MQNILENNADDKILFFVNSIKRLKEMFCYFGDNASYLCSKSHKKDKDKSLSFVDYDCIHNSTFDKRILFVTKTLDNGVDLVDINIKHVFCEIIDIDSAIQAIGRKRCPKDEYHPFSVYFKEYDNRPIRRFADIENENLIPVNLLINDKESFMEKYGEDRQMIKHNKILYAQLTDGEEIGEIRINHLMKRKLEYDYKIHCRMLEDNQGFKKVFLSILDPSFQEKIKDLVIDSVNADLFNDYLLSIEGTKLFKPEQQILKNKFRTILGLKDRYMGINTLNGKLKDCSYPYEIISKQETKGINRKKQYWQIVKKKQIS